MRSLGDEDSAGVVARVSCRATAGIAARDFAHPACWAMARRRSLLRGMCRALRALHDSNLRWCPCGWRCHATRCLRGRTARSTHRPALPVPVPAADHGGDASGTGCATAAQRAHGAPVPAQCAGQPRRPAQRGGHRSAYRTRQFYAGLPGRNAARRGHASRWWLRRLWPHPQRSARRRAAVQRWPARHRQCLRRERRQCAVRIRHHRAGAGHRCVPVFRSSTLAGSRAAQSR